MSNMEIYLQTAANIHDQIEEELHKICIPGAKLIDIVIFIENRINELTSNAIKTNNWSEICNSYGLAFPVGINLNNIAAHYSPVTDNDTQIITDSDIVTLDYGIHFDGYILDAAFTFAYDDKYKLLLECGIKATQTTANMAKAGMSIYTMTKNILNVIKKSGFTSIGELCGHQIKQYKIHSGFVVPNLDLNTKRKLLVGDVFTIEPFISTHTGKSKLDLDKQKLSHVMFNYREHNYEKLLSENKIPLLLEEYSTLAFNLRHIDIETKHELDNLINQNIYQSYPPILEINPLAYVCQFETTLYVKSETEVINFKKHKSVDHYIIKDY